MLCGIQTFQSRPVELLDPVKKPEDVDWFIDDCNVEVEEVVELEADVDELLENVDENHPVFVEVLGPDMLEAVELVVWLFYKKRERLLCSALKSSYCHLRHLVHCPQFWSKHWFSSLANQVGSHNIWRRRNQW